MCPRKSNQIKAGVLIRIEILKMCMGYIEMGLVCAMHMLGDLTFFDTVYDTCSPLTFTTSPLPLPLP